MQPLQFLGGKAPIRRVLALGAHADDIEIGCGATMLALKHHLDLEIAWVVLGAEGDRAQEARSSAEAFLSGAGAQSVECFGFRDGFFPYLGGQIKDVFEELKSRAAPDVIFTHARGDLHQDHRLVCELTWNTWRDHLILEYEIPKYEGDLGSPDTYVPVSKAAARGKASLLMSHFASQRDKHWFDEDLFLGLMRVRGSEARSPSGYAEAFYARKLVLAVGESS